MMKRRRMDGHGEDLADVNEQELAKDGGAERDFGEKSITGTDAAENGSAPVCDENGAESEVVSGEGEILPTPVEPVTDIVNKEETPTEDLNEEQETPREERADEENEEKHTQHVSHGRRRRRHGVGYAALIALCFVASVALLLFAFVGERGEGDGETEQTEQGATEGAPTDTQTPIAVLGASEIYGACADSVVTVAARGDSATEYGSGFCVFDGGFIATLYETVSDAKSIEIILADGSVYPARTVGGNATVNLALLQADAPKLKSVAVGSSESLAVGSGLYAIGSMGDGKYGASLVSCEVSFAARSPELMGFDGSIRRVSAVQISGDFDETMKGCPIFLGDGNAVAVLLSVGDGVSFALPFDKAVQVLGAFRDGREPSAEALHAIAYIPPALGILGEQAEADGICGIKVMGFEDDNSDAATKLRAGDLIFRINDTLTPDTVTLAEEIEKHRPGENVEIYVYRNGQKLSFYVLLSER